MKRIGILMTLSLFLFSCAGDKKDDFKARLNYLNSRHSFRITFPESWINYSDFEMDEIIDPDLKITAVYFALPTRSRDWQPVNVPAGYAAMFSVRIFTPDQWTLYLQRYSADTSELNSVDRKIGESSDRIFMIRNSSSLPVDLYLFMKDVTSITDSFRTLNRR